MPLTLIIYVWCGARTNAVSERSGERFCYVCQNLGAKWGYSITPHLRKTEKMPFSPVKSRVKIFRAVRKTYGKNG